MEENLKCPRKMGLMAYVNRAADDPARRSFKVNIWLRNGMKYEGLSVNVPEGGYTQQDMVLEGEDNGSVQTVALWDDICLLTVFWK